MPRAVRTRISGKVCRAFCSVYLFFIAVVPAVAGAAMPHSASDDAASGRLVAAALEQRLYEDRYWDVLLHYRRAKDRVESLVDDPRFFLAPTGKTDPAAELTETINGLFDDPGMGDEHPTCRFPARARWLRERLGIRDGALPVVACEKLTETLTAIDPRSSVFIFPAGHKNSPASMFGHTLLRVNSGFRSDLVSHAVNYAAVTNEANGFLYAIYGIFGHFKGYYSILPYYAKVSEYNDLEHRDLWEYELNLTEDETRRMVLHIWELAEIWSDYYFFDENCSFNLFYLLEAARPTLRLTSRYDGRFRFWVIPSDTIRDVIDAGLVERVKYRPSQATRIKHLMEQMPDEQLGIALDLIGARRAAESVLTMDLDASGKQRVLNLAAEFLQYQYGRAEIEKDQYLEKFLAVLRARSTLGADMDGAARVPAPAHPEAGHRPGALGLGGGYQSNSSFTEFRWRAAYHDLMDPEEGFVEGAQINFFDFRARYYFRSKSLRLQSARFIDIVSLSSRDRFFKPVSWKVNTGFEQKLFQDGKQHPVYRVNPGGGFAWHIGKSAVAAIMLESDLNLSGRFEDNISMGFGPSLTFLAKVRPWWKARLFGRDLHYALGDQHRLRSASFAQQFRLNTNAGLELSVTREQSFHRYQTVSHAGYVHYY